MRTRRVTKQYHKPRHILPKVTAPRKATLKVTSCIYTIINSKVCIVINSGEALFRLEAILKMIKEEHAYIMTEAGQQVEKSEVFRAAATSATFPCPQNQSTIIRRNWQPNRKPINGYILYRLVHGRQLHRLDPSIPQSSISSFTGALWNNAPAEVRKKYATEALRLSNMRDSGYEYSGENIDIPIDISMEIQNESPQLDDFIAGTLPVHSLFDNSTLTATSQLNASVHGLNNVGTYCPGSPYGVDPATGLFTQTTFQEILNDSINTTQECYTGCVQLTPAIMNELTFLDSTTLGDTSNSFVGQGTANDYTSATPMYYSDITFDHSFL